MMRKQLSPVKDTPKLDVFTLIEVFGWDPNIFQTELDKYIASCSKPAAEVLNVYRPQSGTALNAAIKLNQQFLYRILVNRGASPDYMGTPYRYCSSVQRAGEAVPKEVMDSVWSVLDTWAYNKISSQYDNTSTLLRAILDSGCKIDDPDNCLLKYASNLTELHLMFKHGAPVERFLATQADIESYFKHDDIEQQYKIFLASSINNSNAYKCSSAPRKIGL